MPTETPLTLTPAPISITIPSSGAAIPDNVDACIANGWYAAFPAPWGPAGSDPAIRITATNNATSAPVALLLVDRVTDPVTNTVRSSVWAELSTLQPGQSLGGGGGEYVEGLPVTNMYLVAWFLSIAYANLGTTFTVDVGAFKS